MFLAYYLFFIKDCIPGGPLFVAANVRPLESCPESDLHFDLVCNASFLLGSFQACVVFLLLALRSGVLLNEEM